MKRLSLPPCLGLALLASGCISQIRDEFDETRVSMFNKHLAQSAYHETSPLFCAVDCPQSFKQGFMAGFIAMMNGANGCPPIFPPSSRICSLAWLDDGSPEMRRNAWYDGYSHGVLAAQQTGAVDINRMPARLPQKQVIDLTVPTVAPTEFLPLGPLPTQIPLSGELASPPPPPAPAPDPVPDN